MNQKIGWHSDSEMVNLCSVIETLCYMTDEDSDGVEEIMQLPSIDLVRCKECKWFPSNMDETNSDEDYLMCPMDKWTNADDFCSCGERKESE